MQANRICISWRFLFRLLRAVAYLASIVRAFIALLEHWRSHVLV